MAGLLKYFEQGEDRLISEEPIVGHTIDGFPITGARTPFTTQEEYEQIPLIGDFRSQMFCMWVAVEKAQFDLVMDHVCNGGFFIKNKIDIPVPDLLDVPGGSLKIWLEWIQVRGVAKGARDALSAHMAQQSLTIPLNATND